MVSESNGDGTFKLKATLQMKFNKSDDGDSFRCIVQPQPGCGNKVTTDRRIFVPFKLISKLAMLTLSVHCEPLKYEHIVEFLLFSCKRLCTVAFGICSHNFNIHKYSI